jgi:GDP-L-fucose synthase
VGNGRTGARLYRLEGKRVWVAGHAGLVGSALVRRLLREGCEVLTAPRETLDLRRQSDTEEWLSAHRPQAVFVAAARVGGIHANATRPAEFIYENLAIQSHVIHGSWRAGVEKLLFLGSSCIYPRAAPQPMPEEALLTGALEPTNEAYAVAKIAGLKLCQAYRHQYGADFISAQPTNCYGPGDHFEGEDNHVVPALLARALAAAREAAPELCVWGTGNARRELLYVDDLADALVFLMRRYSGPLPLNVGTGQEVSIRELAETVARVVGYRGRLVFDPSRPDGAPRKLVDSTRLRQLGWRARVSLYEGLSRTCAWLRDPQARALEPSRGASAASPSAASSTG